MKKQYLPFFLGLIFLFAAVVWWFYPQPQPPQIMLKPRNFSQLPGWGKANVLPTFEAFKVSCRTLLKQNPDELISTDILQIKVKDIHPACQAAMNLKKIEKGEAKLFFEKWFKPMEFNQGKPIAGLFTGYYQPTILGRLQPSKEFNVPIYGLPSNLITLNLKAIDPSLPKRKLMLRLDGHHLHPFYTRKEIDAGAIKNTAPVLAWIKSPIDRLFLEIQGSGFIQLENGDQLSFAYAGENGAKYTAIAQVLINKGILTKDNASMQGIKKYLIQHPEELNAILHQNKSFVFFRITDYKAALGAQGVPLTPGYSLAIDRKWIPLGFPLWLTTSRPTKKSDSAKPLRRLFIAQDTGGAIRGIVRGDVFWGSGDEATFIAGHMKNPGFYWLFLPRDLVADKNNLG